MKMGNRNLSRLGVLVVVTLLIALPLPCAFAGNSSDAYVTVAVLDSTATPLYAAGTPHNDVVEAVDLLDRDPHILAQAVNNTEIQADALSDYDVLFLIDNWPENASNSMVEDFWKNGGGIVALDGSLCTLCYLGILPAASAGDNGIGTYWDYDCNGEADGIEIYIDHPVTKGYLVGEILWPSQHSPLDAGYHEDWIEGEPEWDAMSKLAVLVTNTNVSAVSVYQPSVEGRVVHIWNDWVYDSSTRALVLNAVRWAGKVSLEDQLNNLQNQLNTLKNQLNSLEDELSSLEDTLTAEIADLETKINNLETTINNLETELSTANSTSTTRIDDLEDKLNTTTIISYGGIGVGIIGIVIATMAMALSRKKPTP